LLQPARSHTPRINGRFSRMQVTGLSHGTSQSKPLRPSLDQVQSSRLEGALGWSQSTLRSTLHDRFSVQRSPTIPGPRGLHPQRADFQNASAFAVLFTTPTVCRTFQSFGRLRNLPCATAESVRAKRMRRIGFCEIACVQALSAEKAWIEGARIPAFSRQGPPAASPHFCGAEGSGLERAPLAWAKLKLRFGVAWSGAHGANACPQQRSHLRTRICMPVVE
jgi:hypothetical protein